MGEGGWTIWGRGGHNRGEVNKVALDNSKMVMCAGGCPLPQRPST